MIDWTDDAREVFDRYALRVRGRLQGTGADPEEVLGDLRQHIEETASERGLTALGAHHVEQMLEDMGEPEPSVPPPQPRAREQKPARPPRLVRLWLAGVVLPTLSLAVQAMTGMISGFLEPMPTVLHGLLIATVPIACYLAIREVRRGPTAQIARVSLLVDFALGITAIYTLLFIPLLPISIFLTIFGLGLLGLSPLLSLLSLLSLRKRIARIAPAPAALPRMRRGVLLSLLVLFLVEAPILVTEAGLHLADSPSESYERVGLWLLRRVGNESFMRASAQRESFEEGARRASLLMFPARMLDPVSSERARDIYYRATGSAIDGKPLLTHRRRSWDLGITRNGIDEDLGGDRVGTALDDLTLSSSRIDVHVKPEDSLAYMEWTQEFSNTGTRPRESRAQWRLPEGAVISRVTLWVEGEPREAAFGASADVRRAYQEVAVKERRDPLLVTWSGPNSVLVQAFPILPNVPLRIRIGVTVPVQLGADKRGRVSLPELMETNYALAPKLRHHLWVESNAELRAHAGKLTSWGKAGGFAMHGSLTDGELNQLELDVGTLDLKLSRSAAAILRGICLTQAACPKELSLRVEQRWLESREGAPKNVAIVIDGSAALEEHAESIARLVERLGTGSRIQLWLAADQPLPLSEHDARSAVEHRALAASVREAEFIGGMDNAPALMAALDWLETKQDPRLLWIHGPQALSLSSQQGVEQRVERSSAPVRWTSLQLAKGPHRLLQALAPKARIVSLSGASGLERLAATLSGGASWTLERKAHALPEASATDAAAAPLAPSASDHVVRLWARDLIAAHSELDELEKRRLGVQRQLVTHLTGAVVLERQEQYDRHDLDPVDPSSVPSIPEPPLVWLLAVAALMLAAQRLRGRRLSWRG